MANLTRRGLTEAGLAVDLANRGEDALWMSGATAYDVIVLDVLLPGIDGFETCRRLRAKGVRAPVLMLTARGAIDDRVLGLDSGADDYLTKPFHFDELTARLRALARRAPQERPAALEVGDLRLDPASHEVHRRGRPIRLSPTEYALLHELMRNAGRPCTRAHLLAQVWDLAFDPDSNVVDVYIGYLRDKIDRPFGGRCIETVRGTGYRVVADIPDGATDRATDGAPEDAGVPVERPPP